MKLIIFLTVLMVAMPLAISVGQVGDNAVALGPTYIDDNLGLSFFAVHRLGSGPTWVAGNFGVDKDAAVVDGQFFALFEVPGTNLFVGPVAAIGADWVSGPMTLQSYAKWTSGAVAAYSISDQVGLWGFAKYRFAFGQNLYSNENTWLAGIGFYYTL